MKKILISFAALAVSAAAIIAVNANNRMDEHFEANVEALADTESGSDCTFNSVYKDQGANVLNCNGHGTLCCTMN